MASARRGGEPQLVHTHVDDALVWRGRELFILGRIPLHAMWEMDLMMIL